MAVNQPEQPAVEVVEEPPKMHVVSVKFTVEEYRALRFAVVEADKKSNSKFVHDLVMEALS